MLIRSKFAGKLFTLLDIQVVITLGVVQMQRVEFYDNKSIVE